MIDALAKYMKKNKQTGNSNCFQQIDYLLID